MIVSGVPELGIQKYDGCTADNRSLVLCDSNVTIHFTTTDVCNICEVTNVGHTYVSLLMNYLECR